MPIQKASRELKAGDTRLGLARITAEVVPLRFQTDAIQYAKQRPGNAIHQRSDIDGPLGCRIPCWTLGQTLALGNLLR